MTKHYMVSVVMRNKRTVLTQVIPYVANTNLEIRGLTINEIEEKYLLRFTVLSSNINGLSWFIRNLEASSEHVLKVEVREKDKLLSGEIAIAGQPQDRTTERFEPQHLIFHRLCDLPG